MADSMYWDAQDLMSRGAMFNFAVGGRGVGKTYNGKYRFIKKFINSGRQFIYLRRYKSEFDDKQEFVADVRQEFPGCEFKVDGMKLLVRGTTEEGVKNKEKWRVCCHMVTLANALTKKSVPYPDVDWILFDEFIIDKGSIHYLANEVKQFLDFYNTVDRFQDRVRVLFLANAVSIVNPYFIYFHLRPRKGKRFLMAADGYTCVEMVESSKFKQHVDNTRFGKMIRKTAYYDYAVGNSFADDNDRFIHRKSEEARFYFALKFDDKVVGVWVDYSDGVYYVCNKFPRDALIYVLTKEDMEPNLLMIEKSSAMLKSVKRLYMQGSVYFDTVQTREHFMNVLEYLSM